MTTATDRFARIAERFRAGEPAGICSVCSAHPVVIEAALRHGLRRGTDVLIEATCNQVNQDGGYTGMTPADFRRFVERIAAEVGFPLDRLVLGGDHLGPNPWKALAPDVAMQRAEVMIAAFAEAGFTKLHLDTSMGCAGEPPALADAVVAERAARLAARAEQSVAGRAGSRPVYVVGTEVPVPGGAFEALDHLAVTTPDAARRTIEVHREAFAKAGLMDAFGRAVGAVVQPGVEFGNAEVVVFEPDKAQALSAVLGDLPGFVFEAHSTDYQPVEALAALVRDGFVILKVGPWLTFALREALYGLSVVAEILAPEPGGETLPETMERVMLGAPDNWRKYYPGTEAEQRIQRHYSFSDRIRYYWPEPEAQAAVDRLLDRLGDTDIPLPLVSQHLGQLYPLVERGAAQPRASALLLASVERVLDIYADAIAASRD
ncbi:D-tagatose-bisphosphate aldolase, class II, non-catalytic subunit [Aureimonas jatrophae]|uniref:Tagatose-bisphosphate aldolase noncatalytic subunit n=1 Tax=Aureimonas jatrophae TaxID=1166073 RepID=A0A1H0C5Z9_9HYPH|nr:D-tagatose-bisphosphate aldolase, class II, non-catalytic subunit [Aureimonas jatrophae]MBB3949081.1 D-tagatose-1,6-bisphosphate aldolase subunit GatZ/KbaZ [Aureimonas jatrophae]SDN53257.1 tagatose-bisphosphate aldolase noncatalytic subunit [Aureimonas jatrophae]